LIPIQVLKQAGETNRVLVFPRLGWGNQLPTLPAVEQFFGKAGDVAGGAVLFSFHTSIIVEIIAAPPMNAINADKAM